MSQKPPSRNKEISRIATMLRKINGRRVPYCFCIAAPGDPVWGDLKGARASDAAVSWPHRCEGGRLLVVSTNFRLLETRERTAVLLHESGHLNDMDLGSRSKSQRELFAHAWAIRRAKRMGWARIHRDLADSLEHWGELKYHSAYRIYRLAHRLAKKKRILERELGGLTPGGQR